MGQPLTPGQPQRSTSPRSPLSSSLSLPTPPQGWPIGSYPTYAEAQRAVDYLSDQQFPVENVTIVGVNLMQVERVTGRLSWPKVLGGGMLSGAWLGLFIGLVLGMFSTNLAGSLVVGTYRRIGVRIGHRRGALRDDEGHKGFRINHAACRGSL